MTRYTPVQLAFNSVEPEGGANEKPPIIFVHGLSASKDYWDDIPKKVANATKRKVYAIDARNHGDSEWSDTFNFDCNVDDLLHFMDSIKAPKAIIVGHSMGGVTAIKAALRAPERIEKIISEDMSVKRIDPQITNMILIVFSLLKDAIQQVPNEVDEKAANKIVMNFVFNGMPEDSKKLMTASSREIENIPIQVKRTEDGRYAFKANINVLEQAMKNTEGIMSDHTGVFEGPASFIYGKISAFLVGEDEADIKTYFPNAELVGIENATHSVHTECPQEFTEAVINFILKD